MASTFHNLWHSPAFRAALVCVGYLVVVGAVLRVPTPADALPVSPDPIVEQGRRVWLRGDCCSCHSLYGLGGHMGPDLTNVARDKGKDYAGVMVKAGRPGMPAYAYTDDELAQLNRYLAAISDAGSYPFRKRPLPLFGDVR